MLGSMLTYGLDLGGPGDWHLKGFNPGDQLRTDWYDERKPPPRLPHRRHRTLRRRGQNRHERALAEE
ncbi:hypothetical protein ACIG87_26070 [Micromonospora sp. NPDC051925]|uniref:hypothetical protein n=1 Tax=Micromonospora sp. NPDC051925 TaxID=3364288 RepID=UPI0037CC0971